MKFNEAMAITISLLFILSHSALALYSHDQVAASCSSEDLRQAAVDKLLRTEDCVDYECGLQKALSLGLTHNNSANSCAEIFNKIPHAPSGYYWLKSDNSSAVSVYCDMILTCKGVGGGWMQVVKLDMTNISHPCPQGTRLRTDLTKRVCAKDITDPGCSSTIFNVHGIEYREVCGKIIAYQDGSPDTFGAWNRVTRSYNIDGNYIDGITLTHGSNPREHIWSFAAALDEVGVWLLWRGYCSCTNITYSFASRPPSFVRNDYFCDTGSRNEWKHIFYPDNPLWDGAGCGQSNTCCSLNNPPWFLKQLPSPTTDDIEMRMCSDQGTDDEGTPFEIMQLYVR